MLTARPPSQGDEPQVPPDAARHGRIGSGRGAARQVRRRDRLRAAQQQPQQVRGHARLERQKVSGGGGGLEMPGWEEREKAHGCVH